MKTNSKVLFKGIFLIILGLTIFTGATSSDMYDTQIIEGNRFSTTTLDFSQRDTSNNQPVSTLFNLTGIIPGGFKVEGVRVKKDGKMGFRYKISTVKTAGNDNFCEALELTILQDWQIKYQGSLLDFSYNSDMRDKKTDDFIYYVKLTDNNVSLVNTSCDFNFVFKTWKVDPDEQGGFFDQEILNNHITSGFWAIN